MAPESLYQGVYTTKSDVWVNDSHSLGKEMTPDWNVSTTVITSLACVNIRFPSLFATGDVTRGGMSATQGQKFHTDDVKSVWNPVRSADWSTV